MSFWPSFKARFFLPSNHPFKRNMTRAILVPLLLLSSSVVASAAEPLMCKQGDSILRFDFSTKKGSETIGLRKRSQIEVKDGMLQATPPNMNRSKVDQSDKWADSAMTRIHFPDIPQNFICRLRWKYNKPPRKMGKLFLDVGHRCIRTTLSEDSTTLQFIGLDGTRHDIDLDSNKQLKLRPDHWYEILIEVHGEEILVQIDNERLYGKHELIAKHNAPSFNIDSGGAGFAVDEIEFFEVEKANPNWEATKASWKK